MLVGTLIALAAPAWAVLASPKGTAGDDPAMGASRGRGGDPAVPRTLPISGRVLDPDGRPVAGARVILDLSSADATPDGFAEASASATTEADGRFALSVQRERLAEAGTRRAGSPEGPVLAAFAAGYGPAWTDDLNVGTDDGATLTLVRDEVPIEGRIRDLEGRPIAGLNVRSIQLDEAYRGDLSRWLEAIRAEAVGMASYGHFRRALPPALASMITPAKTDAEGRFRLAGIGRERLASLLISGAGVETQVGLVMTRGGPSSSVLFRHFIAAGDTRLKKVPIHAARFELVAAPGRMGEGTVDAADTRRPLPGVTVRAGRWMPGGFPDIWPPIDWPAVYVRATSDEKGHFRLPGLPATGMFDLVAEPAEGQPYMPLSRRRIRSSGTEPLRVEFPLSRGVPIRGRVKDGADGRPIAAVVAYYPKTGLDGSELLSSTPRRTHPVGWFEVVAFPGSGVVTARARGDRYMSSDLVGEERGRADQPFPDALGLPSARDFDAYASIVTPEPPEAASCDLVLTPAPEPVVTVLDPDGRPLAGAVASGVSAADEAREAWWQSVAQSRFRVTGLTGHRIRRIWFHHEARRLAGSLSIRDGDGGPLVVRMRPWGVTSGRLVDREGRPRPGVPLSYRDAQYPDPSLKWQFPKAVTTDGQGVFSFQGLVPEQEYTVMVLGDGTVGPSPRVGDSHTLTPGETRSLGDVREAGR
ncbi:carboxypeptidase regulatory-like domain-containing protein [Aquisphaera giovannonii]|nr:carboxypeptidase regulatory-like domain-containing protein [Aquisphaera giovannonii]